MYINKEQAVQKHIRKSKTGIEHSYTRTKTIAVFRCDNCDEIFRRELKKISSKRLSNNYFHVCSSCDAKRFAQRKGVEQKKIWDMPASVELPVGKF
jgi:hypothetical protein